MSFEIFEPLNYSRSNSNSNDSNSPNFQSFKLPDHDSHGDDEFVNFNQNNLNFELQKYYHDHQFPQYFEVSDQQPISHPLLDPQLPPPSHLPQDINIPIQDDPFIEYDAPHLTKHASEPVIGPPGPFINTVGSVTPSVTHDSSFPYGSLPNLGNENQLQTDLDNEHQFQTHHQFHTPTNTPILNRGHHRSQSAIENQTFIRHPTPSNKVPIIEYQIPISAPSSPERKALEENELKIIALENCEKPINELIKNFNIKSSKLRLTKENKKQIIGLIWIINNCQINPTSVVPRNKVYSSYCYICSKHGMYPLSPANFGKLIKLLFSNIAVRRLEIKRQSKYHYCGFKLVDDDEFNIEYSKNLRLVKKIEENPSLQHQKNKALIARYLICYNQIDIINLKFIPDLFTKVLHSSSFNNEQMELKLPKIYLFLTDDIEFDSATTLYSLYQINSNKILNSVRYFKTNELLSSLHQFINTLPTQVIKLYTDSNLFQWVKICDLLIYKKILLLVLNLYKIDKLSRNFLTPFELIIENFNDKLFESLNKISNSLNKGLNEFINFKLKISDIFIDLLSKLIKILEFKNLKNTSSKYDLVLKSYSNIKLNWIIKSQPVSLENSNKLLLIFQQLPTYLKDFEYKNFLKFLDSWYQQLTKINPRLFLNIITSILNTIQKSIDSVAFSSWFELRSFIDDYISFYFQLCGLIDSSDIAEHEENKVKLESDSTSINQEKPEEDVKVDFDLLDLHKNNKFKKRKSFNDKLTFNLQ